MYGERYCLYECLAVVTILLGLLTDVAQIENS